MPVPDSVVELVERFERNLQAYRSGQYNETQLRREFIDPFFKALGWDVDNEQGYAEAYKDVVHEDAIKVGGATKAPDYCLRIGGTRKFFVEAKKPSVNLKGDISPAFQVRRYAWSAKLPLSILTDFEEFAVYDCRIEPQKTDKASTARTLYLTYDEYIPRWEEISEVFSREAVLKGSFDKYAQTTKRKRGTAEVDAAFLKEIESWRELLARNLALRNTELSRRELNFAVQRTIDRIIFLRICEDRGIEPYGQLMALQNGSQAYQRLCQIFHRADERYNSGLFHFREERGRAEPPDDLTLALELDDKPLRDIIKRLYYPDSPYEFYVLPADILGQVYEQFLGKVIRLTPGHRAVIEDKPEVKKAGGVYYTPTYIVDYIVKNTVGKLLQGKTPRQAEKLRILDPACGSGSFLIGAYQHLLDWHRDWYIEDNPKKWAKGKAARLYQGAGGDWRLTTAERKRILLNNICGVDIDHQAVEVTKLSLLLKVLEGESQQTLATQLRFFQERALPDLGSNIKCGNSLIGTDFYDSQQMDLFDEEERLKINAFDWETEFPDIMKAGGFDAVIGNPPYGAALQERDIAYLAPKYATFESIKDAYVAFVEQAHKLLTTQGRFGFIIPSAWTGGPMYSDVRSFLLKKRICRLLFLPFDVFHDAYIDTVVLITSNEHPPSNHSVMCYTYPKKSTIHTIGLCDSDYQHPIQVDWASTQDQKFVPDTQALILINRLDQVLNTTISDLAEIRRGVLFDKKLLTETKSGCDSHPYFEGNVYRYRMNPKWGRWIEYGSKMKEYPRDFRWFEGPRLLLRRLVNRRRRLMATYFDGTVITDKNLYVVRSSQGNLSNFYLLGILNSKLVSYLYLSQVSQATKDDFPQLTIRDIKALPVPLPKNALHDLMVKLVEQILALHKQLADARTAHEKTALQRQIDATDRQIDQLVYELYGLTDEEIEIVESDQR